MKFQKKLFKKALDSFSFLLSKGFQLHVVQKPGSGTSFEDHYWELEYEKAPLFVTAYYSNLEFFVEFRTFVSEQKLNASFREVAGIWVRRLRAASIAAVYEFVADFFDRTRNINFFLKEIGEN